TVPAGAHVIDEGGALFAKRAIYGRQDAGDVDGPVIRLVGEARFSKVAVHRGNYDAQAQWRHWRQQPETRPGPSRQGPGFCVTPRRRSCGGAFPRSVTGPGRRRSGPTTTPRHGPPAPPP